MKRFNLRVALVAGLFLAAGVVASVAGMWTGLPTPSSSASGSGSSSSAATLPLTGNETGAFDTNLSGGRNPQTLAISTGQLRTFMFGNNASASGTQTTAAATGTTTATGTCNAFNCAINTAALTTAAGSAYTLTLSNSQILSTSVVLASIGNVSNTSTGAIIHTVTNDTVNQGAVTIVVGNSASATAFNGTLRLKVLVLN